MAYPETGSAPQSPLTVNIPHPPQPATAEKQKNRGNYYCNSARIAYLCTNSKNKNP